jgi:ABC-type polysaccharide transport system permease subunit
MKKQQGRKSLVTAVFQSWQLYAMLLPSLVYLFIFQYYPMLGAQIAFKDFSARLGIWGSEWVGFKHFIKFIDSYQFWPIMQNTIIISVYSIIAALPIPIVLALGLNSMRGRRYKKTVQLFTYLPNFISTVVMVGILRQILNPQIGLIAYVGDLLGITVGDPFASSSGFSHLYVWTRVWQQMGWSSIIYFAALSAVDPAQHEAAIVDGANRFQRILYVDLPVIVPTAVINLILSMGRVMSIGFERIFLMQTDLNISASEIISTYVYKVGLTGMPDYSYSTAINLFNSVINLLLILLANQLGKKVSGTGLF